MSLRLTKIVLYGLQSIFFGWALVDLLNSASHDIDALNDVTPAGIIFWSIVVIPVVGLFALGVRGLIREIRGDEVGTWSALVRDFGIVLTASISIAAGILLVLLAVFSDDWSAITVFALLFVTSSSLWFIAAYRLRVNGHEASTTPEFAPKRHE